MRQGEYERRLKKIQEWKKVREKRRYEKFLKWRRRMREAKSAVREMEAAT